MTELYHLMENELSNPEQDVARMTELLRISSTKFYYKVKGLTGENPSVFFKTYKLNRAAELIKEGRYTVSGIADMTGFSTLPHFLTSFKRQFGIAPSEYDSYQIQVTFKTFQGYCQKISKPLPLFIPAKNRPYKFPSQNTF